MEPAGDHNSKVLRMLRPSILAALVLGASALVGTGSAHADPEAQFFQTVAGRWIGPGEIVAGKYKGTKFSCDLSGATTTDALGVDLGGNCRVGLFGQEMKAAIRREKSGYVGSFLDGAAGAGLDIIGGEYDGERMVFTLDRKQLNGAMVARLQDKDSLNVTISVRVGSELVPVIGMTLQRSGEAVRQTALD